MKIPDNLFLTKRAYRQAEISDINQILNVRNSVTENRLSIANSVTARVCVDFISKRGRGWVCEIDNKIIGFAIVDLKENSVWALFLRPEFERHGIGRKLHDIMLSWYFEQTKAPIELSTSPNTRAETFYRKAGWIDIGIRENGETMFELKYKIWEKQNL